ncbi:MAG: hypothetical protein V4857_06730 [Pseudomonadota bacterium]
MRKMTVLAALLLGLGLGAHAHPACVDSYRTWPTDFNVFLAMMQCASAEVGRSGDRTAALQKLSRRLRGAEVRWTGTIRVLRKNRVFFDESEAPVAAGKMTARVMYFVPTPQVRRFRAAGLGKRVHYTGKIGAIKTDAIGAAAPLFYVELLEVGIDPG